MPATTLAATTGMIVAGIGAGGVCTSSATR
jgi:hypothetical protein